MIAPENKEESLLPWIQRSFGNMIIPTSTSRLTSKQVTKYFIIFAVLCLSFASVFQSNPPVNSISAAARPEEISFLNSRIEALLTDFQKQQAYLDDLRKQQQLHHQQQQEHEQKEEEEETNRSDASIDRYQATAAEHAEKLRTLETAQQQLERSIADRLETAEARLDEAIEAAVGTANSLRGGSNDSKQSTSDGDDSKAFTEKEGASFDSEEEKEASIAIVDDTVNIEDYEDLTSTVAFSNTTTVALKFARLYSGFRNQMMAFTAIVLQCNVDGHGQILLESIHQKDTYGSNKYIPFARLWDVPHWNSHYPKLPRLVRHDPVLHDQWDPSIPGYYYDKALMKFTDSSGSAMYDTPTRPYISGKQHHMFGAYQRYSLGKGKYLDNGHRNPAEILMLQGAMRPHPKLRNIIDGLLASLNSGSDKPIEYLTLHARIEPDMQRHNVCRNMKVLRLKEIFDWMEEKWPEPPVTHIFMPINREFLEKEGSEGEVKRLKRENKEGEINQIAVENLRELNRAGDEGLWQGRVRVFEFGSKALQDTEFRDRPSTTGALINFFIAIGGSIFIGTEVSSYSHDILATRFFRDRRENYKYLPDGLHHWTPPGLEDPPGFTC